MATHDKIAKTMETLKHLLKQSTPQLIQAALDSGMIKDPNILEMLQQQLPNQTPML